MDEYLFKLVLTKCKSVVEETRYLEILNYSDPFYNRCEEHPLPREELDNFICQKGTFSPPSTRPGVKLLGGIRLVIQSDAQVKDTFSPHVISFTAPEYETMVREMRLPLRAIEGTSIVGPFFWSSLDQVDEDPHLQIIYRKSDVKKRGRTRGWEMMLSHSLRTSVTMGYTKGTPSSEIKKSLGHLRECAAQASHPMLLPVIVLSHDLSSSNDEKQRAARDWLRHLENAISLREEIESEASYFQNDVLDFDTVSRDIVECHSQVLWKRPQAWLALIAEMGVAMNTYKARMPVPSRPPPLPPLPPMSPMSPPRSVPSSPDRTNRDYMWSSPDASSHSQADAAAGAEADPVGETVEAKMATRKQWIELDKLHRSIMARFDFYRLKLVGTEHYAHTSLKRLKIQREALYNILAQRESRINMHIANEQKRLADASKRDGKAMKTLSLLGALFLPGTYLASVFSMGFFNFDAGANPVISPVLWVYFAITVPVTASIVAGWFLVDRRRQAIYQREDEDPEKNIEQLSHSIMATMRKRTLSKVNTWNTVSPPPR